MKTSRKILFALAVNVLFFGGLELALRFAGFEYLTGMDLQFFGPEFRVADVGMTEQNHLSPQLFWEPNPGATVMGNLDPIGPCGLRGYPPVQPERAPGSLRVACLGDSCTFGFTFGKVFSLPKTYPGALQRLLREHYPGRTVDVINGGCTGYSIFQGQRVLTLKVLPLHPDYATFYFGAYNDYTPAMTLNDIERGRLADGGLSIPPLHRLLRGSRIYQFLTMMFFKLGVDQFTPREKYNQAMARGQYIDGPRVPVEDFERIATEMIATCRKHGIQPILMVPPLPESTAETKYPVSQKYAAAVRAAAEQAHAPMIDLRSIFAKRIAEGAKLFHDFVHPNEAGMVLIAREIAAKIQELEATR